MRLLRQLHVDPGPWLDAGDSCAVCLTPSHAAQLMAIRLGPAFSFRLVSSSHGWWNPGRDGELPEPLVTEPCGTTHGHKFELLQVANHSAGALELNLATVWQSPKHPLSIEHSWDPVHRFGGGHPIYLLGREPRWVGP